MHKLPVLNIIIEAFWIPWKYKLRFFNMLALPMVMVVGITTFLSMVVIENHLIHFFLYLIYLLSISFFAIKCHRFILISSEEKISSINSLMLKRVVAFFVWMAIVYIVVGLILMLFTFIGMNTVSDGELMKSSHRFSDNNFSFLKLAFMLPAGYILSRLSLVFPATAVDKKSSMKWSWEISKNNGLRMFSLVAILPWITTIFLDLLWRENGTMLEYVFLSVLGYIVVAIEIFILSLAFKELCNREEIEKHI